MSRIGGLGDPVSYVLGPFSVFTDVVAQPPHGFLSSQVGPFALGEDVVFFFCSDLYASAKKPFSPDPLSPHPDEMRPLFAFRPPGSSETSLHLISCIWCAWMLHFRSFTPGVLGLPPFPPSPSPLSLTFYPLLYRPPA